MSKSKMKKGSKPAKSTKPAGPGKGHFTPVPLTFTGVDGKEYTYGGRGRYSVELARVVVRDSKVPTSKDGTWSWRDGTADEVANCAKLVKTIDTRAADLAAAKAEKAAARAAKKAAKPAKVKKTPKTAPEAPVTEAAAEAPVAPVASV